MTLMKRPVHVSTLVSAIRTALRDRRRQYAVRDLLAERQEAAEALRRKQAELTDFVERRDRGFPLGWSGWNHPLGESG